MCILKPKVIEKRLRSADYIIEFRTLSIGYKCNIGANTQQIIPVSFYNFDVVKKIWTQSRRTKMYKETFKSQVKTENISWVVLSITGVIKATKDYSLGKDYEINTFMENICKKLLNGDIISNNSKYKTFFHTLKLITLKNENISLKLSHSEKNWFHFEVDTIYSIKKYF